MILLFSVGVLSLLSPEDFFLGWSVEGLCTGSTFVGVGTDFSKVLGAIDCYTVW
jgi:hypothetical protein